MAKEVTSRKPKVESKTVKSKAVVAKTKVAAKAVPKTAPKKVTKKETLAAKVSVKRAEGNTGTKRKVGDVTIDLYAPDGTVKGKLELPTEYFAAKINKVLMAQAVRIYLANQREGGASTKTRGEVEGSTRKIYKQKGTGRARHGGIRAPIFVGGGITFGPRPHSFTMSLPQKMRKLALASALTNQLHDNAVKVVDGVESLPSKTKAFALMFEQLSCNGKTLFFLSRQEQGIYRAVRNLATVDCVPVTNANTYETVTHRYIVFTKQAINELTKRTE
jgi:large subunit ribosomal protein L4